MRKIVVLAMAVGLLIHQSGFTQQKKEPGAATEPVRLIRGPYLQVASSTGIMIRWRTDVSSRSRVRYGLEAGKLDQTVEDLSLLTEHKINLLLAD
jgi:hypothetical protein